VKQVIFAGMVDLVFPQWDGGSERSEMVAERKNQQAEALLTEKIKV